MRLFVFTLFLFTATLLRAQDTLPVARLSGSIGPGIFQQIVPLETGGFFFYPTAGYHDSVALYKAAPSYAAELAWITGKHQRLEVVGFAFRQWLTFHGVRSHYQETTNPDSMLHWTEPLSWELKMRAAGLGVNYSWLKLKHWEAWGGARLYYLRSSPSLFRGGGFCVQSGVRWKPVSFLSIDFFANAQYLYPFKVLASFDGATDWTNASFRSWFAQAHFGISVYISNAPVDNRYVPEDYPQQ